MPNELKTWGTLLYMFLSPRVLQDTKSQGKEYGIHLHSTQYMYALIMDIVLEMGYIHLSHVPIPVHQVLLL